VAGSSSKCPKRAGGYSGGPVPDLHGIPIYAPNASAHLKENERLEVMEKENFVKKK